jgi:hypothetical protein
LEIIEVSCYCVRHSKFTRTLAKKTTKEIKGKLAEELYMFRASWANRDLIFELRQSTEKNWEYGKEFLMVIIHYKKAFDTVKREEIWKSVAKIEIAADLFRKVKNTYDRTINCIKTNKAQSAWIETRSEKI